jgi:4-hydroxybenzoate polyprenyltransferase
VRGKKKRGREEERERESNKDLTKKQKAHSFSFFLSLSFKQAILGLTFNWGALLGWTAVKGGSESILELAMNSQGTSTLELFLAALSSSPSSSLSPLVLLSSPAPWLLYSAGICWTLCYDTIYAYQDSRDDAKAGVRSSALALKRKGWEKGGIAVFGAAAVALLAAAGESAGVGCPALYGALACGPGMHMAWQVTTLEPGDAGNCATRFRSNAVFGGLVSAAFALGVAAASS